MTCSWPARQLAEGDAVGPELVGVDLHLVLLHHSAHRGHFRHAGNAGDRVPHRPVLEGAQIRQRVLPGLVDEGVFEDPADAGRIGAQGRRDAVGELPLGGVEVLEDAASGPVEVGAVFEDDVHERHAEHRLAPHRLHLWRREQRRHDRVGDLVLDQIRAAAHPLGPHDDLGVGQVGDRIEPGVAQREHPPRGHRAHQQEHDERVSRADRDQRRDRPALVRFSGRHRRPPTSGPPMTGSGSRRRSGSCRW